MDVDAKTLHSTIRWNKVDEVEALVTGVVGSERMMMTRLW